MDPIVDKEIVELKQQIKMLIERLADQEGKGQSNTSEVIKVVIPARHRKVRKYSGEVEEDLYLLEDFFRRLTPCCHPLGGGLLRRQTLLSAI